MVRLLFLAMVVTLVAAGLPAVADDAAPPPSGSVADPAPAPPPAAPAAPEEQAQPACVGLLCSAFVTLLMAASPVVAPALDFAGERVACQVAYVDVWHPTNIRADPDGCWSSFVHHTLGWTSDCAEALSVWTAGPSPVPSPTTDVAALPQP